MSENLDVAFLNVLSIDIPDYPIFNPIALRMAKTLFLSATGLMNASSIYALYTVENKLLFFICSPLQIETK